MEAPLAEHGGIGNEERVGRQLFLVVLDVIPKADTATSSSPSMSTLMLTGNFRSVMKRFKGFQVMCTWLCRRRAAAIEDYHRAMRLEAGEVQVRGLGRLHVIVP